MFILTNKGFFCIMCLPLAKTQEGKIIYKPDGISIWAVRAVLKIFYMHLSIGLRRWFRIAYLALVWFLKRNQYIGKSIKKYF